MADKIHNEVSKSTSKSQIDTYTYKQGFKDDSHEDYKEIKKNSIIFNTLEKKRFEFFKKNAKLLWTILTGVIVVSLFYIVLNAI